MLHNLSCCKTRFRLLCRWYWLHSSLNLAFRQRKLHNIFIFGMAYSSHHLKSDIASTAGKHTQMTKENSKRMRDLSASNISHVSSKPLKCAHIAGHVVEVTFRNHYNAYDMFSNRTRLSSSFFNIGKVMYSGPGLSHWRHIGCPFKNGGVTVNIFISTLT